MKIKFPKLNKKYFATIALLLVVFVLGFVARSFFPDKIAFVDLEKVVANSEDVYVLHKENDEQIKDLSKWLDGVSLEIASTKGKAKKEALAKEYKLSAKTKENKIKKDYQEKLEAIHAKIKGVIKEVASLHGCENVFLRNAVILGGVDITQEVIEKLNPKN